MAMTMKNLLSCLRTPNRELQNASAPPVSTDAPRW
jgi:hypothetical protein